MLTYAQATGLAVWPKCVHHRQFRTPQTIQQVARTNPRLAVATAAAVPGKRCGSALGICGGNAISPWNLSQQYMRRY